MTSAIHLVLTLAGVLLVALTLPLVLELALTTLAGLLLPRRAPHAAQTAPPHNANKLIVIVPAHNEELLVARTMRSLLASANGNAEICLIAHNCTDATAARAREAEVAGLRPTVLEFNDPSARGKGFALRWGFAQALARGASAVMVVDADSTVSANTIPVVLQAFRSGAHAIQCRYEMHSATGRANTELAALAFRGFNVIRPRGRQRLGLSSGILGNGFALARTVLETIPYDAFSVVEDLEYHLHLVIAGERVHYLEEARISADFPESQAGESVQRSRWEGGRFLTARRWALPIFFKMLGGRPRLFEPLCDLTGLPLAFGVFAILIAAILPLGWLRWYAAASLCVVFAHVVTAAVAGPNPSRSLQLLAMTPWYILRKLWMIPALLRGSSKKAAWVRTERDNTL
ncbi:MAG TPA: glycosyltransferase family 2 protein [Acidobacteriaceae bacterium]|nr:glycosyltransferase family 2 protein [Acidobacteriaceae bacterium]